MTFARLVLWRLKPGRREEALEKMDGFGEEAMGTPGFKGILAFRSVDEPNTAYLLSFWDSEESLNAATNGILKRIMESVSDIYLEPPVVKVLESRELAAKLNSAVKLDS